MAHNNHIIDNSNKDIDSLLFSGVTNRHEAKEYYLNLAGDWEDPNPPLVVPVKNVSTATLDLLLFERASVKT